MSDSVIEGSRAGSLAMESSIEAIARRPAFCASQNRAWLRTRVALSFLAIDIRVSTAAGSLLCDNAKVTLSRTTSEGSCSAIRFRTWYPRAPREFPSQNEAFSRTSSVFGAAAKFSNA